MNNIMILKESLHETREKTLIVIFSFSLHKAYCHKSCFISFYIFFGVTFCLHQNLERKTQKLEAFKIVSIKESIA